MNELFKNSRDDYKTLKTEERNERSMNIDKMSTVDMMRLMNDESRIICDAIDTQINEIAKSVDIIAKRIESGGSLIYVGAGTSGRLGVVDASECPPTFGVDYRLVRGIIAGGESAMFHASENVEDNEEQGKTDLIDDDVKNTDVVVGLSASGGAPYVLGALKYAKSIGATTIGITCNSDSRMHKICDITIAPYVGPEVVTGSSRLKAGTAQKMVLNMLSTGAMIKTGKVRSNLMINVRPTNAKLRLRCIGIVCELCGCDEKIAAELIDQYEDISIAIEEFEKANR